MSLSYSALAVFEGLESRRLLSVAPASIHAPEAVNIMAAPHVPVADDAQLVGNWTGKLKATVAKLFHKSFDFTMDVIRQSSTHLDVTIKVDGKTFSGTIPVHFEGGGHVVKFKFHTKHIHGSLKLWVSSDNNSIQGKFEGSGHGIPATGSLKMTKDVIT